MPKQSDLTLDPSQQIAAMADVLSEVTVTWELLQETIEHLPRHFDSPTIQNFRRELLTKVRHGIALSQEISDYSEKLAVINAEAERHIVAMESHFNETLSKFTGKDFGAKS